jgi:ABC-2 type transport system permease protein
MWRRDVNYLLANFYWPVLDILVWGFLGSWIAKSQTGTLFNYEVAALLGILLWQVVGRGCNIINAVLSEELWSHNIINLFSLPLALGEWICGALLYYVIMMSLVSIFCMCIMFSLYDVAFWYTIKTFLIFVPPLIFSAIWLGFTCLQIMIIFGKRGVELGYVIGWFFLPFSGAYYPIDVLPAWGKTISTYIPMSYVFQGMRGYVMSGQDPLPYLLKGYLLGILYAAIALIGFVYCFNRSKHKGLARLVD